MIERIKKCIGFIFRQPVLYICASFFVLLLLFFGCQGLMNVNGEDNQVIVSESFKGGNK